MMLQQEAMIDRARRVCFGDERLATALVLPRRVMEGFLAASGLPRPEAP